MISYLDVTLSRPDHFTLGILPFRARRNFFPSSPGACSQASLDRGVDSLPSKTLDFENRVRPRTELFVGAAWTS